VNARGGGPAAVFGPVGAPRFAAAALGVLGVVHLLSGTVALVQGTIPTTPSLTYTLPPATWGWTQVVLGAFILLVGAGVLRGRSGARLAGVVLAACGLFLNFLFLLLHPVWAILIIVVDVLVIAALTVRWPERD
jgi:hypothetical protein